MAGHFLKFLTSDLAKASSFTFLAAAIRVSTQLIAAKIIAQAAGPVGVALFGQLSNMMVLAMLVSTAAISVGVTKYIAEYRYDKEIQAKIIQTANSLTAGFSVLASVILVTGCKWLSILLFGTAEYTGTVALAGACIGLYAFHNLWIAILNGFTDVKKIVVINIVTSIAGLLLTIILAYLFKARGAMIALILGQTATCIFTGFYIRKEQWIKNSIKLKIYPAIARKLFGFSVMSLTASVVTPVMQLIIRNKITIRLGADAAGIWEGLNRISGNYLMIFTSSVMVYYLPKLSSLQKAQDLRNEIKLAYKLIVPLLLSTIACIYFLRHFIIKFLFTAEFLPMEKLFSFQLGGDLLKMASWLFGYLMWAKGYVKEFVITEVFFGALLVILTELFIARWGLPGTAAAYCITYCLYFICISLLMTNKLNKLA